jgi:NAD(P)-dependent dehydrogenase (short-subunit alcohol dehydrogenase family)
MNVNYMGIIRITKALLPSLRAFAKSRHTLPEGQNLPRARLVSVTSVAGRTYSPGLGPYCASKHAAEAILDTLRVELSPWEIDVTMIEPFFAKTPIVANGIAAFEKDWEKSGKHVQQMYGQQILEGTRQQSKLLYDNAMPPELVVQATVNAIHKKNGARSPRILVGYWYARIFVWFFEKGPEWLSDAVLRLGMRKSGSWAVDPFLLKDGKQD